MVRVVFGAPPVEHARQTGVSARNRKLYGLRGPEAKPREAKPMRFKASCRHQYWTVDVRSSCPSRSKRTFPHPSPHNDSM
jgi:hypothetical protein